MNRMLTSRDSIILNIQIGYFGMKSSLLSLYAPILVPIYSEWISTKDLCFLDTAVCRHKLREWFLHLLTFSHSNDIASEGKSFDWMMIRCIRIKILSVSHISPNVELLIQSKGLSCLIIGLQELARCKNLTQISAKYIQVVVPSYQTPLLEAAGFVITDLTFESCCDDTVSIIATCCPYLKKVSAALGSFILPIVDACQLVEIRNCHLDSLVRREKCDWTCCCNLRRTSAVDRTAVRLGEGKHYHMTALWFWDDVTADDAAFLIPLLPNLTQLKLERIQCFSLVAAAINKCHKLTELDMVDGNQLDSIRLLLQHSPLLRRLNIHSESSVCVDECVAVLSECCPRLEECSLTGCVVESESVMSALFRKCHYLTEFSASAWPYETVLEFAKDTETLYVSTSSVAGKSGRGLRKLNLPSAIGTEVLCAVFGQNPGMKTVHIIDWGDGISSVIESMVQKCPLLNSFQLNVRMHKDTISLSLLGRLLHLRYLSVYNMKVFTMQSFTEMLENKSSSLLTLNLQACHISSDLVAVIARLCPALTKLNLSDNKDLQNADIVYLLNSCSKLESLCLWSCCCITSEILESIRSPPMRELWLYDTGISNTDMTSFQDVEGFLYWL